ncbi:MAG: serine/threonine-protein kinase [Thermodesulfobacteriota bacterium]
MSALPGRLRRSLAVYAVGVAFTLLAATVALVEPGFLRAVETGLLDLRFTARGPLAGERSVAIVAIDDASLSRLGKWPWKRTLFAQLIEILGRSGARVIAFDIFFQPDDRDSLADDTKALARAIDRAGNVILPVYFNLSRQEASGVTAPEPAALAFPVVRNLEALEQAGLVNGFDLAVNEPALQSAAAGAGHINLVPDPDGVTRQEILALRHAGLYIPSFSLQVARRLLADRQDRLELVGGQGVLVGDRSVAVEPLALGEARLWGTRVINWRGDYRSFDYFSAADVLAERFPTAAFQRKIVLVGATSPGLYDAIATPFSPLFPGVEKNANAIDNILRDDFIRRPASADLLSVLFCLGLGLTLTLLLPQLAMLAQGVVILAAFGLVAATGQVLFTRSLLWLPLAAPLATVALVSLAMLLALFLKTRQEHAEVVEERFETIVELGLAYQQKGLLELAYQHFAKLPLNDDSCRLLYNLAVELQRKRKSDLAITILKKLYAANRAYEDVAARLKELGIEVLAPAAAPDRQGTVTFVTRQASAEETSILKPGQTLGRYEVQRLLGRGNMGAVYLAQDPTIDRPVAIKTFHLTRFAEAEDLAELKRTFVREAQMAGRLNHPNIVTIFDAGEDWDLSFIAMEVLEGVELKTYCQPNRLLPLPRVLEIVRTIALALDYAHSHGVVHRDVKPANIMVLPSGQLKLTDFGIALVRGEMARIAGTPSYMAPEQLSDGPVDGRTDLYALGVVLFELLSGRKPFAASDFTQLRRQILTQPPPRIASLVPELPPALDEVVARLLAKAPDDRFSGGWELDEALSRVTAASATMAPAGTRTTAAVAGAPEAADATMVLAGAAGQERPPASPEATVVLDEKR